MIRLSPLSWPSELTRRCFRLYAFQDVLGYQLTQGGLSSGYVQAPMLHLSAAGSAVAEGLSETGELLYLGGANPEFFWSAGSPNKSFWAFTHIVQAYIRWIQYDTLSSSNQGGIEIGSFRTGPPWGTTTTEQIIQLYAHFTTGTWRLRAYDAHSRAADMAVPGAPSPNTLGDYFHLMILYQPGGPFVGVVNHRYTAVLSPGWTFGTDFRASVGAGCWVRSGLSPRVVAAKYVDLSAQALGAV